MNRISLKDELSNAELTMFNDLGFNELISNDTFSCIDVIPIYRMAVEKAFINNMKGRAIDALRAAYKSICDSKYYRQTEDFDNLILQYYKN